MDEEIVFFDGICNLCTKSVLFILKHERKPGLKFASLQGKFASMKLDAASARKYDSILYLKGSHLYYRSSAALRICGKLRFPLNLLYTFLVVPAFLRDPVYDFIASRRYHWFGRKEACWIPDEKLNSRFYE